MVGLWGCTTSIEFTTGAVATLLARINIEPWDVTVLASLGATVVIQLKLALTDVNLAPRVDKELTRLQDSGWFASHPFIPCIVNLGPCGAHSKE